jgi:multicomponent Na+:H+ antiporter subunit B
MIRRVIIILTLVLTAIIFARLVLNYSEHQELGRLGEYYASEGPAELGAPNLVTAVVVTYRGLDTLGEVTVLFISAAGAGLMLRRRQKTAPAREDTRPASEIVITATQLLVPIIFLFGVYVFVNGHLSPGGGFQGGAIVAAGSLLILLALPQAEMSHRLISLIESLSGFSYVLVGLLGVLLAGGFLDNRILPLGTYGTLFSAGAIPIIYTLVGLKVGSELSAVLDRFRERG